MPKTTEAQPPEYSTYELVQSGLLIGNTKPHNHPPATPARITSYNVCYTKLLRKKHKNTAKVQELVKLVVDRGGLDYASEQMNVYRDRAIEKIMQFPETDARTSLIELRITSYNVCYTKLLRKQIGIKLRLDEKSRSDVADLKNIDIMSPATGQLVSLGDVVEVDKGIQDKSIYRKNQRRVVYVTADVAGSLESPVYGILSISDKLKDIKVPEDYHLNEEFTQQPFIDNDYTLKWDGEWQITYEVFRDLGTAFAVVLLVIYLLIIGWFQDFKVPIVMMIAIPLSLVGILIGHWIMGAFFVITSYSIHYTKLYEKTWEVLNMRKLNFRKLNTITKTICLKAKSS